MSDWLTKYRECPDCRVERTYVALCEAHGFRNAFGMTVPYTGPIGETPTFAVDRLDLSRGLPAYVEGAPDPARLDLGEP
jgi:hypothetical protein